MVSDEFDEGRSGSESTRCFLDREDGCIVPVPSDAMYENTKPEMSK